MFKKTRAIGRQGANSCLNNCTPSCSCRVTRIEQNGRFIVLGDLSLRDTEGSCRATQPQDIRSTALRELPDVRLSGPPHHVEQRFPSVPDAVASPRHVVGEQRIPRPARPPSVQVTDANCERIPVRPPIAQQADWHRPDRSQLPGSAVLLERSLRLDNARGCGGWSFRRMLVSCRSLPALCGWRPTRWPRPAIRGKQVLSGGS